MTRPRGTRGGAALAVVGGATTLAALTGWAGFVVQPSDYLGRLLGVALLVVGIGIVLRRVGAPSWTIALVQLVAGAALVCYQVTGSAVFVGGAGRQLLDALHVAVDSAQQYAAPIHPKAPPVWPLMVAGGALFLVLVDLLACSLRRVPAAGLGLLAIYSVPSGLLADGPGWGSFLAAAIGFLLILHLETRDHLQRWGRLLGPGDSSPWRDGNPVRDAVRTGAGRIGITATALALVVPTFLPVLDVNLLHLGNSSGDGDIRIHRPVTNMRRDLDPNRPDPPLVRLRTDDPAPSYLRISVLNRYTGNEWSSGDRDVATDHRADGPLPAPDGLSPDVPRTEYSYDVETTDAFRSTWLPTQFPATAVEAHGDWRYDPTTLDFLAADDDLDTHDTHYSMTGLAVHYGTSGRFFRDAPSGAVQRETLDLPSDLPPSVRQLARDVTDPADNDYERALLLQDFFRRTGGFRYSLERAPQGTGNDTLAAFLARTGRVGYCEQYASAMAVMARVVGIPARVAVGFLQPDQIVDGRWEYSAHDLHAWPELYFAGAGWVRFEPTPSGRVPRVPDYSRVPVGAGADPSLGPSLQPSGSATNAPAPRRPTARPTEEADAGKAHGAGSGRSTGTTILLVLAGVVLLLVVGGLLLLVPRAARDRARRARLGGGPDQVWAELRATALDLGLPWPEGRSPRVTGEALATRLGDPADQTAERPRTGPEVAPEAAAALDRLVLGVERARYARPGAVATRERTDLATDGMLVIAALESGAGPRARQRARWFPRSLWQREAGQ